MIIDRTKAAHQPLQTQNRKEVLFSFIESRLETEVKQEEAGGKVLPFHSNANWEGLKPERWTSNETHLLIFTIGDQTLYIELEFGQ